MGLAATTVTVPDDRDVAFAYVAGGPVEVAVDGRPLDPDVTGDPPVKYFTLTPPVRRTGTVHLTAGTHDVRVRVPRPDDLPDIDHYVSLWVTDGSGAPQLDVVADRGPRPA